MLHSVSASQGLFAVYFQCNGKGGGFDAQVWSPFEKDVMEGGVARCVLHHSVVWAVRKDFIGERQ